MDIEEILFREFKLISPMDENELRYNAEQVARHIHKLIPQGEIRKNVKEFLMNHYLVTSGDKYRLNTDDLKNLDRILKGETDGK